MTRRLLPAVAAALVAAGLATLGAAAPDAPSADLANTVSTAVTPKVEQFVETGVLPSDVRGEPGVWNYAGPAGTCPGLGWNCVTLDAFAAPPTQVGTVNVIECVATTCVSSTQTGYANTFECTPAGNVFETNTAALQACGIDQVGTANDAKCVQKKKTVPFVRQRCSITQTGKDNAATIVQVIEQTGGNTQGGVQEAGVLQVATASKNQLQVNQEIKQFTNSPGTQDQDAYQVVTGPYEDESGPALDEAARQTGPDGTDNQAQIDQKQIQHANGGTVLLQNDGVTEPLFTAPDDCNDFGFASPTQPNVCANLAQDTVGGDNQSQLAQAIENNGATPYVAEQLQGSLIGGVDGHVHQSTEPEDEVSVLQSNGSSGSNSSQASQSEIQRLVAASDSTQEQIGPLDCCGIGSQVPSGTQQIAQKSDQHASEENAEQFSEITGTSDSGDGTCEISHDAKNNSGQSSESFSFQPCFFVIVETICQNPPPDDEVVVLQAESCTTEEIFD